MAKTMYTGLEWADGRLGDLPTCPAVMSCFRFPTQHKNMFLGLYWVVKGSRVVGVTYLYLEYPWGGGAIPD